MSCPGYGRKTAVLFWQGDRTIEKKRTITTLFLLTITGLVMDDFLKSLAWIDNEPDFLCLRYGTSYNCKIYQCD